MKKSMIRRDKIRSGLALNPSVLILLMFFCLTTALFAESNFSVSIQDEVAVVGTQKSDLLNGNAFTYKQKTNGEWENSNNAIPDLQWPTYLCSCDE